MIDYNISLYLLENRCKKNLNKPFTSCRKSQVFDSFKCQYNRERVLGRVESLSNTINLLFWSSKEDEL